MHRRSSLHLVCRGPSAVAVAFLAAFLPSGGCGGSARVADREGHAGTAVAPARTMTAEAARLLSSASDVARLLPGEDCEVDRSTDMSAVVDACIELGDLDRAEGFAARVENWRRGEALVRIGRARLRQGDRTGAERCAMRALDNASGWKDWGIARASAAAAGLWMELGDPRRAQELLPPDQPDLRGAFEASRVGTVPAADLPALASAFDEAFMTQNLDVARAAMQGYLEILSRGLAAHDKGLVARAESAIDKALGGFPYDLQVAYSVDAAGRWLAAGDTGRARQQLRRADDAIAKAGFEPDALAPSAVALVAAEFRLGDRHAARARLDGLRDAFAARMSEVTDLRRATPLRAMAETYELLGDRARAADCYADALREGSLNPNARPRANDLCLTLVSMARCGFVPDVGMDRTIASIRGGLAAPW